MILTSPGVLIRLEGLIALISAGTLYRGIGGDWGMFALLFLVPDISILPYLAGKRIGAISYNLVHSYTLPLAIGLWAANQPEPERQILAIALIWVAHIAFDRALGFGLKFPEAFRPTHIQSAGVFRG